MSKFAHSTSTTQDTAPLSSHAEGYLERPLPIAGMAIAKRTEKLHQCPPGGVSSVAKSYSVLASVLGSDCMARTCSLMLHHVILEASLSSQQAKRLLS